MATKRRARKKLVPFFTTDGQLVYISEGIEKRLMKVITGKSVTSSSLTVMKDDEHPLGVVIVEYTTKTGKGTFILEGQSL